MRKREGNRPDRRYAPAGSFSRSELEELSRRLCYGGSSNHKLHPGDYGFVPSINPRPAKSLCDDHRVLTLANAVHLFRAGIVVGMVSPFDQGGTPKYVWAVESDGEVYESKTKPPDTVYHGYRLGEDEIAMRRYILDEWGRRCPKS
jgi:hypothetical protein